jgi:hypothetical protein
MQALEAEKAERQAALAELLGPVFVAQLAVRSSGLAVGQIEDAIQEV